MQLIEYLEQISVDVDAQLEQLLPCYQGTGSVLSDAMRYSVFNGGKRLRPALFCATMTALGKSYQQYLSYAAAVEMIHCYSLIHDDLPAIDDDLLRRGKPTCHVVYGEDIAILAGDALLNRAAEILTWPIAGVDPTCQMAAAREIMSNAGKMVHGQAIELAASEQTVDLELLDQIYQGKTSALFSASVLGAATLVGADEEIKLNLEQYCQALGLAFQIVDDILDIQGDEAVIGKPAGSDIKNEKRTYPLILGCEQAQKKALELALIAVNTLKVFGNKADMLRLFPEYMVKRKM